MVGNVVHLTPTLLENIRSVGGGIDEAQFKKGQRHPIEEDFEGIHFTIAAHTEVYDASIASFGNGVSIQDTLLRRCPQRYLVDTTKMISHFEREIERYKQKLEPCNKTPVDLRASNLVQVGGYESAIVDTGLPTPMSTTDVVSSRHSTSNANEENQNTERMIISTDTSPEGAVSSAVYESRINLQAVDPSLTSCRKRKPTDSDDRALQESHTVSQIANPRDSNTPLAILVPEDTGQDEVGGEHRDVLFDGGSLPNIGDFSTLEDITRLGPPDMTQDAMEGIQMHAEQQQQQEQERDLSGSTIPENQAPYMLENGHNESLTDFMASVMHIDMFSDNVSLSLSPNPNPNLQSEQSHSEKPLQAAPDKLAETKKKSPLYFHLVEVFQRDKRSRASYPRKPMRRSVQQGLHKVSQWLKGLNIGEESVGSERKPSFIMGFGAGRTRSSGAD
jgi:hypothetical protein